MKYKGPIITLAAGLVLAAVLMALNLSVTKDAGDQLNTAGDATTAPAATAPAETPAPTAPTQPPAGAPVTYAGAVIDGAATVAIVINNGKAVAYLCDGNRTEAWLQGTATNGELVLSGAAEASLTGTYGNGVARGNVEAAGGQWTFSAKTVKPPSGLYRATANVRNAEIVGGWIVLANGKQVGAVRRNGVVGPAPRLNTTTNSAEVDGGTVEAKPVDGTGL